jgi:UDP-GlcNAc3NAcA epimerase
MQTIGDYDQLVVCCPGSALHNHAYARRCNSCLDSLTLLIMKIVSLVDSPAEFIRATALSRVLRQKHREILVHTGPHTEFFQARTYFEHIELLEPEVSLELAPNSQSLSFGEMQVRLERALLDLSPDLMIVCGNSNATLAGALAAARHFIPVARLTAGVRSYNKRQPEELNRVLTDRLADVLFCDTSVAVQRLAEEGVASGVHYSGDITLDVVQQQLPMAQRYSSILQRVGLYPGYYLLAALRSNVPLQEPRHLQSIVKAFNSIREPIIFPMSAQVRAAFDQSDVVLAPHVLAIDPLGYLDMLSLEMRARTIITDADSVQREAYHLAVPCITLRDDTEVRETVDANWNCLVGSEPERIVDAVRNFLPPIEHPLLFGDGHAAEKIADVLCAQPIVFGQNYDRVNVTLLVGTPTI